jgi:hypothetical protein
VKKFFSKCLKKVSVFLALFVLGLVGVAFANPGSASATSAVTIQYQCHIQNSGWTGWINGDSECGTTGQSLRMEAVKIRLVNAPAGMSVQYKAHVQNVGWQGWVNGGEVAGTTGQSLRMEALQVRLVGAPGGMVVQYMAHVQYVAWQQGWVTGDATAGTTGQSLRMEAVRVKLVDEVGPELTAVAHNEGEKTISLTWNEPIQFETEHGDVATAPSANMFNIFVAEGETGDETPSVGDYDLGTKAPDVTITSVVFNADQTGITAIYTGNLVNGTNYVLDSWVAESEEGAGDGGYDVKDLAGNVDEGGIDNWFVADTLSPALASVVHNAPAKMITLTYTEPVHFETEWGNTPVEVSPSMFNIFAATPNEGGYDYDLETIAPNATITGTSFNTAGTVLTFTYSGTLEKLGTVGTYLVDSWVVDTTDNNIDDAGWDIKDASGNVDSELGAPPVFTVFFAGPQLAAVAHNEIAKTITYIYNEPVQFTSEQGDVAVAPENLKDIFSIFVATWNEDTSDWDYDLVDSETRTDTRAPGVAVTGAVLSSNNTILTVTYTGTLVTSDASTNYILDSWVPDSTSGAGDGGYDVKDEAGNVDAVGPVSPVFNVVGNGVVLN